jgi:hypothetical protein
MEAGICKFMSFLGVEEALTSSVDIQRNPLNGNERECRKGSECLDLKHYESDRK